MLFAMRMFALVVVGLMANMTVAQAQTYVGGGTLRVGAFGQMSAVSFDIARTSNLGATFNGSQSSSGWGGGIAAGYDQRLGISPWIIGGEIDGSLDDAGIKADNGRGFNSQYLATLRGRLGYNLTNVWMLYGTAGYALHGLEMKGLGGNNTNPGKVETTRGGLVLGGGTEYDLDGFTVFAEYLHTNTSQWNFIAPDVPFAYKVDDSTSVFRLGVKFKVGHDYDHDIYRGNARRY